MTNESSKSPKQLLSDDELNIIARAVETLLGDQHDAPVAIANLVQISEAERRNLLLRATLNNPPAPLPESLIIKKVVVREGYNPDDAESWDTKRFLGDWAGAAFLTHCAHNAGHGPRFYGGDRTSGYILLEDMGGEHKSLVEPLLGADAAVAEQALLQFTERLAHMHVDTAGRASEFYALMDSLNPQLAVQMRSGSSFANVRSQAMTTLAKLGITPSDAAEADLDAVAAALADPGPFLVYLHSDPCPDNFFWQGATLRLMDFEFGHMGHALRDLAYGRMFFPTCWCCNRVPDALVRKMEQRYRQIFSAYAPPVLDDAIFGRAMTVVCADWVINSLSWLLEPVLEEEREWGIANVRPRIVARLEAFISTSKEFAQLPGLRELAAHLLDVLQEQWPDLETLPLYPPFRANA